VLFKTKKHLISDKIILIILISFLKKYQLIYLRLLNEVTLLIKNLKGLTPNPSPKGEGSKMKSG